MLTFLIFIVFLFSYFKKTRRFFLTLGTLLTISVASGLLPYVFLKSLQKENFFQPITWQKNQPNIIIVLGGGLETTADNVILSTNSQARLLKGMTLFHECKKISLDCKLLFSGGFAKKAVPNISKSEAQLFKHIAQHLEIPENAILFENKSLNTWQNAQYTQGILANQPSSNLVLVTSSIHVSRSLLYFKHFGLHAQGIAADVLAVKSFLPNGYNFSLTDACVSEFAGIARYYLYNILGMNETTKAK